MKIQHIKSWEMQLKQCLKYILQLVIRLREESSHFSYRVFNMLLVVQRWSTSLLNTLFLTEKSVGPNSPPPLHPCPLLCDFETPSTRGKSPPLGCRLAHATLTNGSLIDIPLSVNESRSPEGAYVVEIVALSLRHRQEKSLPRRPRLFSLSSSKDTWADQSPNFSKKPSSGPELKAEKLHWAPADLQTQEQEIRLFLFLSAVDFGDNSP